MPKTNDFLLSFNFYLLSTPFLIVFFCLDLRGRRDFVYAHGGGPRELLGLGGDGLLPEHTDGGGRSGRARLRVAERECVAQGGEDCVRRYSHVRALE